MIGQFTEAEFFEKYDRAQYKGGKLSDGLVWLRFGATINYYRRESDGSWTNYDCRTRYTKHAATR
jgi:hypothetical protein